MQKLLRSCVVIVSAVVLSACSNLSAGNLFSHYTVQNQKVQRSVKAGDYEKAASQLPESMAGDILDNFEKGRVYLLNEQYEESSAAFSVSDQAVRQWQDQATISISETATDIGSLAVNDNLKNYQPSDYELGFLHLYMGLGYLIDNDLEGALIEMRRANQVQERAKQTREKELQAAESELKKQGISPNLGSVLSRYPDAGEKLQAVQNGYLLFLSGLLYETEGDLNSAYVDYRRALTVLPDNLQVIESSMRVARRLGMNQDLELLTKRYGELRLLADDEARVIVIDEQSVVEAMQGWQLSLPVYDSRGNGAIYSLALPYYQDQGLEKFSSLQLNNQALTSSQLVDVNLMAQNDLSERMTSIVIRQALRVYAKDQIRKSAAKGDDVGNLLFNVWNTLTEQPDTRSWQTLPGQVRSASMHVPAGEQSLKVGGEEYKFNVDANRTVLVWVSRQGQNSTIWHKQLGNLR